MISVQCQIRKTCNREREAPSKNVFIEKSKKEERKENKLIKVNNIKNPKRKRKENSKRKGYE